MPPRVLVVGSLNMDLVVSCPRLPRPGETLLGEDFRTVPGGKGANQAVACARLGAATTLVGRVGEDDFGRALRAGLVAEGVGVGPVLVDTNASTGVAVILLEPSGSNRIIVVGGANAGVGDDDVARAEPLLDQCDALLLQLEIPLPIVTRLAAAAHAAGVRVVLDAGAATGAAASEELFACLDVLSPNETETETLTGLSIRTLSEAYGAAHRLQEMGARQVVLKLGKPRGLWLADGIERQFPAFSIDPVDTTAAGDAFTAALTVGLAAGLSMEEALPRANAAGALACLTLGAQPAMPTAEQVEELLGSEESKRRGALPSSAEVEES